MGEAYSFTAGPENEGARADAFFAALMPALSRASIQKLAEEGLLTLNGTPVGKNYRLHAGDTLCLSVPAPVPLEAQPQAMDLDIVFEDDQLIVVNKPKGMVVHPGAGNREGTLVNGLLFHAAGSLSGIGGVERPGIVHRIDKDTSGLLVVAKTDLAHRSLAAQLEAHTMVREYRAVVYGNLPEGEGTVDAPLGRSDRERTKMAVKAGGRRAVTHFTVVERLSGFTHISCRLETGRTHQIRVHMASLGHPLAGDAVYGPRKVITALKGQCLHAKTLGFVHPVTGKEMRFDTELPAYFTAFCSAHTSGTNAAGYPPDPYE